MAQPPLRPKTSSLNCIFDNLQRYATQQRISADRVKRFFIGGTLSGLLFAGLVACDSGAEFTITFCDTSVEPLPCSEAQTEFSVGQPLYVRLVSSKSFEATRLEGKILRLTQKDTITLGSRIITLEPGQQSFIQTLPFHEFGPEAVGAFLIRFVNEDNQLVVERKLTITESPSE